LRTLGRGKRLYAIAFWLFYAETGAIISPPLVGLGSRNVSKVSDVAAHQHHEKYHDGP
jgi:hypothetical protein